MRLLQLLPAVFVLAVFVSGPATAAPPDDGFKLIHVNDLVALRAAPNAAVTVLDANAPDFRAREGVIPGAVLLSSDNKYDVAKELPPQKDARLVFYCANIH
jgi:rhodanese-related sulfurtransferase